MKKQTRIFEYIKEHPLISIFTLAVLVRVLLLMFFPLPDYSGGDFSLYQRIADSIVSEGNFGGEPQKTYGSPSINPGWAFFLAGISFLFGKSQIVLLTASVLFGGLLAIGTYLLSTYFFNKRISLLAGSIAALWPVFLIQTFLYTDSLLFYTVLLLWSTFFFVKAVLGGHWSWVVISGLLLGFAILIDSIAFFIPLLLLFWVFIERPTLRSLGLATIFLGACFLVVTPWVYRNVSVAENMGLESAPTISKGELTLASPDSILTISKLVIQDGVMLSGLSKAFVFPFNISILDQGTTISYKDVMTGILRGERPDLSNRETAVISTKVVITTLHWLLLALSVSALFMVCTKRRKKFFLFITLLLLYVVSASIGYGSLWENDFQGISALSSFLFPLLPFLVLMASFSLFSLHTMRKSMPTTRTEITTPTLL